MKLGRNHYAFTLLEVVIALGIFCMAVFAILDLVNQNLRAARLLQLDSVDAGGLAAELMLTNKVEEGADSGDFGDMYPGYSWSRSISEVSTNGLFQVDFTVSRNGGGPDNESHMSMLLYRPDSAEGAGAGRRFIRGGRQ